MILGVEAALAAAVLSAPQWTNAEQWIGAERWTGTQRRTDYVAISAVAPAPPSPRARAYTWSCATGHRNTANVVVAPGVAGSPHHVHEYVGNLSTDVESTLDSLAVATTSCPNGDLSTYYWPALRTGARAGDATHGRVAEPVAVTLTAFGSPVGPVVAMPRGLRGTVGDANAATTPLGNATRSWSCSGTPQRRTDRYPLCPRGDRLLRIFDLPSCWDGSRLDSPGHRAHLSFPAAGGACPAGTFAVPRLRITVEHRRPDGDRFAIDSFPPQRNAPQTDHAFFINLMPAPLATRLAQCLNTGAGCG